MTFGLALARRGIGFGNLARATRGRVVRGLLVQLSLSASVSPAISSAVALALTASLSVVPSIAPSTSSTVLLARTDVASAFVLRVPQEYTVSAPTGGVAPALVGEVRGFAVQAAAAQAVVQALATVAEVEPLATTIKGAEPTKVMFVPAAGLTPVVVSGFTGLMRVAAVEQRLLVAPEPTPPSVEEA